MYDSFHQSHVPGVPKPQANVCEMRIGKLDAPSKNP